MSRFRKMKLVLLNFLYLILVSIFVIVSLEISLRIYFLIRNNPQLSLYQVPDLEPKDLFLIDPEILYINRPNYIGKSKSDEFETEVKINSIGLRDREYNSKAKNTRRILILGDSYTFGKSVEEYHTFPKRLETVLNKKSSFINYQVINAGIIGYGTYLEYLFLEKKGLQLQPDLILIAFAEVNDLSDNLYQQNLGFIGPFFYGLQKNDLIYIKISLLNCWLRFLLNEHLLSSGKTVELLQKIFQINPSQKGVFERGCKEFSYLKCDFPNLEEAWKATEKDLDAFVKLRSNYKIPLGVIYIPMKFRLNKPDFLQNFKKELVEKGFKSECIDFNACEEQLTSLLMQREIPCLSLTKVFRKYPGHFIYWEKDCHFTVFGHKITALAIEKWLPSVWQQKH